MGHDGSCSSFSPDVCVGRAPGWAGELQFPASSAGRTSRDLDLACEPNSWALAVGAGRRRMGPWAGEWIGVRVARGWAGGNCPQRPMTALELSLNTGRAELGVASTLSLVAFDRLLQHGVLGNAKRLPGLDGLLCHAAGVTQRRPSGIPFRSLLARPACPPGPAEAVELGDHCPSAGFAPTPRWHLQKPRPPAPGRPVGATSQPPGQEPRSLCAIGSLLRAHDGRWWGAQVAIGQKFTFCVCPRCKVRSFSRMGRCLTNS